MAFERDMTAEVYRIDSPLGDMTSILSPHGLHLLEFSDRPGLTRRIETLLPSIDVLGGARAKRTLKSLHQQLDEYFLGHRRAFDLPLALTGTSFQLQLWAHLQQIPYAETRRYREMACAINNPGASRAVGLANARNPVAILVPCHRLLGSDGKLHGYGGGLWRKQALLTLEARHSSFRKM
jgi:O-6-methylguanine DNA methyltransferase